MSRSNPNATSFPFDSDTDTDTDPDRPLDSPSDERRFIGGSFDQELSALMLQVSAAILASFLCERWNRAADRGGPLFLRGLRQRLGVILRETAQATGGPKKILSRTWLHLGTWRLGVSQ